MKKTTLLFALFFAATALYAQSLSPTVVASAGGYFTGGNAQLSWTLGETVIETTGGSNVILTQGFQQSDLNVNSIGESQQFVPLIRFYPNPTEGMLNIRSAEEISGEMLVQVFSIDGRLVYTEQIFLTGNSAVLNLQQLDSGSYLLVFNGQQKKQNFTLIKY